MRKRRRLAVISARGALKRPLCAERQTALESAGSGLSRSHERPLMAPGISLRSYMANRPADVEDDSRHWRNPESRTCFLQFPVLSMLEIFGTEANAKAKGKRIDRPPIRIPKIWQVVFVSSGRQSPSLASDVQ